jgi:hypothetical protein
MSKIKTFEYKIKPSENGLVLIDFLINKFTYLSLRADSDGPFAEWCQHATRVTKPIWVYGILGV